MIRQLLDKIMFTIGVIVFIQLPHFVNQYAQRLGGYYESRQVQLSEFQAVANNNFSGDLEALINNFLQSQDPAIVETGENIQQTRVDVGELAEENDALKGEDTFSKILFLATHFRMDIGTGTLSTFKPGIPLNLWALAYGLIGGIIFSLLFNGLCKTPRLLKRKKNKPLRRRINPNYNV